ncbi:hypothetical protein MRX96_034741 [Rhipicephalus microplus]
MAESTKAGNKGSANFMRQFRDKKTRELKNLTASQFMDVWSHYDKDANSSVCAVFYRTFEASRRAARGVAQAGAAASNEGACRRGASP